MFKITRLRPVLRPQVSPYSEYGLYKSLSESAPVEWCQNLLVTVHDATGLPWWASIIGTTVMLRTCLTLPLAVYQNRVLARLENATLEMGPLVDELKKETAIATKVYQWDEKTARYMFNRSVKKQWTKLIERDNCHPLKSTLLVWVQIPMWVSLSVGLRNLVYMLPYGDPRAQVTLLELTVGGFGFIPNLTVADQSWILPVTLGLLNLAIVELQLLSRKNVPSKVQTALSYVFRGISVLMVPVAAAVPSCLVLFWTTSSAYGLAQNLLLMSPKVRRLCRIPKTSSEAQNPYDDALDRLKAKLKMSQLSK
ncbi:cytochrome c oxidase assembly protein COX18, mitochondrial [Cylas formicarius]|uniref:cytochrome c oxidase assembly protein COX18, mitochondrial n=1 Tax=Cylas formicarius TaxID=197179 RepID=UPI002958746A|nr:cytochrome c oxidase assembly protein COX18, mitochondrial [Cylas formicarius]